MNGFFEKNIKSNPGRSALRFSLSEPRQNLKICLMSMDSGFEMNEEMIEFLEQHPAMEVQVTTP